MSAERVVCLAFDCPGISFVEAGIEAGRLPTLAGLLDRGRPVALADHQEICTPPSWPTMIRGVDLPAHGLYADRMYAEGEYRVRDVAPEEALVEPFWRHLSDGGIRSVILSAYSGALLDRFEGVQVCGWGSHDPFDAKLGRLRSEPPGVLGEIERLVGPRAIRFDGVPPRSPRQVRSYVDGMVRGCDQQSRALRKLLDGDDWRFAFASFAECHQAGHWLWHFADPAHPEHDPDAASDVRDGLMRIYEATDRAIGAVLAELPADTVVLILSPYDMGPNSHLDEALPLVLERAGLLKRLPPGRMSPRARVLRAGRRVVRAAVPLALRPALGRLAGRDRLLAELAVAGVDWPATRAMPVPSDGNSAVRLNLVGREPEGAVQPGAEADRVLADMTEVLSGLRCADTGQPVVERVARYEELFGDDGARPADLFIQWACIARPSAVVSERVGEVPVPSARSIQSVHRIPGFIVGAGPGIDPAGERRLRTASTEARLADVGPTVLALFGVQPPPELTGRPIAGLVPAGAEAGA